jgi:hypothetical protein
MATPSDSLAIPTALDPTSIKILKKAQEQKFKSNVPFRLRFLLPQFIASFSSQRLQRTIQSFISENKLNKR